MFNTLSVRLALAAAATLVSSGAMAVSFAIDTNKASNGLTGIFSTSFTGPMQPCTGSSPSYCTFFGGAPSAGQLAAVAITPNPSGVVNAVPGGIAPIPLSGSFLDLTLGGGNVTLNGGSITLGNASITIVPVATTATVSGAGFVFDQTAPPTTAINGNDTAEFLVTLASPFAIDFSAFPSVITGCTGNPTYCGLLTGGALFLDAVKYRLFLQFDPTHTQFNSTLIGQTNNNSMFFVNLDTVPVPAAVWLMGSALGVLGWIRRKAAA